ncbi:MAG TPA: metallopeptidase family protein [Candidatus Nitrosotenuis sp.]|nr:metallopeptidase family protein [Candidatus Nitrosotenuis sp.]
MTRQKFEQLVAEALDGLPRRFHELVQNLAVVVEDLPPGQPPPDDLPEDEDLLMGEYIGTPLTVRGAFDAPPEPDRVVLYQRNIEAYARDAAAEENRPVEEIIREEIRLTVLHELGHYFGMDEDQLEDV